MCAVLRAEVLHLVERIGQRQLGLEICHEEIVQFVILIGHVLKREKPINTEISHPITGHLC